MPDSTTRVSDFVSHEPDPIVYRIRLVLVDGSACACPCLYGRLHRNRGASRRKGEITRATANGELAIGDIVVHVALPGMGLTPGIFTRGDVLCFGEIGRAGILRWIQVTHCHCDPVRCAGVSVAGMIVRARRERARERIHPRA
jgi:hypothetical protein